MKRAALLDIILNSKEVPAGNVGSVGKLGMWCQQVLPPRLLCHSMMQHATILDFLSIHSPRSLPSSTLASLQFFKHAKHISASGSLHLLFFTLEHPSPTYPPGSLYFFQVLTQMSPRPPLTHFYIRITQQDTPYPLYSDFSAEHTLLLDLNTQCLFAILRLF